MPSTAALSIDKLAPLVTGSAGRPWERITDWALIVAGPAVVIWHKGKKLNEGVAVWLRQSGIPAERLEGGYLAWQDAGLPPVPEASLPLRDAQGRTVWGARARPKVDRIACPWLIRRLVAPHTVFLYVAPSEVIDVAVRFGATPFATDETHNGSPTKARGEAAGR